MDAEYSSLRQEILQWQQFRLVLVGFSMALVPTVLGLTAARGVQWELVSGVLLFLLSIAGLLTWYAGRGNALISAYIRVFIEDRNSEYHWESGIRQLGAGPVFRLNTFLALIYLMLGFISYAFPSGITSAGQPLLPLPSHPLDLYSIVLLSLLLLFSSILILLLLPPSHNQYVRKWRCLRDGIDSAPATEDDVKIDSFKEEAMATAIDPICKMEVNTDNPPGGQSEYQGTTYYFCAPGCKVAFDRDPEKYLSGEGGEGMPQHNQPERQRGSFISRLFGKK